ncbi:4Fe-4S dicluster domain-containing protein [Clostridium ganghwense]|uniref:4Fe-4S dicluster domain-containing protein n=1 Tax=Clostridium ganghwense TaxID=312089 RepID=A0ABT4CJF3_9CLOT|nr:reductive dehalogenase domain-containing protein [Clostridium ganghwense]MCY6369184.1 4Fe-4S dicluster domain-containing protein [Clostridium ganghwense]
MKKHDERDVMFSRMNYKKGTEQYEDYYRRNPNKKEIDDTLRSLPNICGEGTMSYNELNSPIAEAVFRFLGDIKKFSEGKPNEKFVEVNPEAMSAKIKKLAKYYGANLVGVTEMKDYHYYSHRGRDAETYGDEITKHHKYGIVFAVEMDKNMINRSPQVEEIIETSHGYLKAGIIGMIISYYIRELGYEARNNMDGNYLVVAPLVAEDGGLGEIGRMGLLCTKKYGPRVRLGVVTTDIPLIPDKKEEFGLKEFCRLCSRCVRTCPAKAIPTGDREECYGDLQWKIDDEKCYSRWRSLGTDCGICLSSCPFSQEISQELVESMKESKDTMIRILKEYDEKFKIRPYIREPLDIIK